MNALVEKLLRLALDPAAQPGEWQNAAVAAVRKLRAEGVRDLTEILSEARACRPPPRPASEVFTPRSIMPFGQYKGRTLKDIAENDPEYLAWVYECCRKISPVLRRQIRRAMEEAGLPV